MDPVVSLSRSRVEVAPGGEAGVTVTVRNPGDLVVEYDVRVLGEAARWAEVRPAVVSLMTADGGADQAEATVELTFRPPRPPAAPAGEIPFGVRCVSREGRDQCAVEEGVVVVATVQGLEAELRPVGRRGRRAGHFGLVLRNTGTTPLAVDVRATDQADRLRFAVGPDTVELPPGTTATAYVAVRPRELVWFGRTVEHPFTVGFASRGADGPDERAASYEQRPVVPRWLLVAAAVVVVALVLTLAVLFWQAPRGEAEAAATTQRALPAVEGVVVSAGEPGEALVEWRPSPYAVSGYLVRLVDDEGVPAGNRPVTDADQGSFVWQELSGGRTCFEVVVLDADEEPGSQPDEPGCVDVVPPPEPSPEPSGGASGAPSDGATGEPGDGAGGGGSPAPSEPAPEPTAPLPPGGSAGGGDLLRWFVIYDSVFLSDTVKREELPQLVSSLQAAGASAQLVEGADYTRLAGDQVHVVEDDFADAATALQRCQALADIAADCIVGPRP